MPAKGNLAHGPRRRAVPAQPGARARTGCAAQGEREAAQGAAEGHSDVHGPREPLRARRRSTAAASARTGYARAGLVATARTSPGAPATSPPPREIHARVDELARATRPTSFGAQFREIGIGIALGAAGAGAGRRHLHGGLRGPPLRTKLPRTGWEARRIAAAADLLGSPPPWPTSLPCTPSTTTSARTGGLAPVVAPPYDVIDPQQRAALLARSPLQRRRDRPAAGPARRPVRARRRARSRDWRDEGVVVADDAARAVGARAGLHRAGRPPPHAPRDLRARPGRGLRPGPDPPARAHAPRPEGGPAAAHARDAREPLADLLALRRRRLEPARAAPGRRRRSASVTDEDGTTHRLWRVADPDAIAAARAALAPAELLIADGHHRYETARVYAAGARRRPPAPATC